MHIHYRLTDADHAAHRPRAGRPSCAPPRRWASRSTTEPITLPAGASLHYQGTVRMGTDDGTSVCDPTARSGASTGSVAGNGVIPTSTACNPTLTSVALAVAGARDIAAALAPASPWRPPGLREPPLDGPPAGGTHALGRQMESHGQDLLMSETDIRV